MSNQNDNCMNALTLIQRTDEEEFIYNSVTYGNIMRGANGEWMRWTQNSWGRILLSLCFLTTTGSTPLHAGEVTTPTRKTSARPPQVTRPRQAPEVKVSSVSGLDDAYPQKRVKSSVCPHCKPKQAPAVKVKKTSPCSVNCVCGCNEGYECTCGQVSNNRADAIITAEAHVQPLMYSAPAMQYSHPVQQMYTPAHTGYAPPQVQYSTHRSRAPVFLPGSSILPLAEGGFSGQPVQSSDVQCMTVAGRTT
jgi:hypothetical protein